MIYYKNSSELYHSVYYKNSSELYHHGILGMKWGIRRYQNKDGTLTPEGRKRLGESSNRYQTSDGTLTEAGRKRYMTDCPSDIPFHHLYYYLKPAGKRLAEDAEMRGYRLMKTDRAKSIAEKYLKEYEDKDKKLTQATIVMHETKGNKQKRAVEEFNKAADDLDKLITDITKEIAVDLSGDFRLIPEAPSVYETEVSFLINELLKEGDKSK